jgi:hypothetical protein
VHPVDKITCENEEDEREKNQCGVQNRAPHKESPERCDIHNTPPFSRVNKPTFDTSLRYKSR